MATEIKISATAKYLCSQIIIGNLTYLEIVTKIPDLQAQMDAWIDQQGLNIDKTK